MTNISRRRFLVGAGTAAAVVAGGGLANPARAMTRSRSSAVVGAGRDVVVLGGGVAGLTAAHELVERGFRVTVIERYGIPGMGGKARSIPVPGTGRGGRQDLPGEHGFRIFFGFYQHLTDTMRRIPFPGNPRGVWDNLVDTSQGWVAWDGGRPPFVIPYGVAAVPTLTAAVVEQVLLGLVDTATHIPPTENAYFVRKLITYTTSSQERRFGELEYTTWWDYVKAETKSSSYQQLWGNFFTADAQAVKSARQARAAPGCGWSSSFTTSSGFTVSTAVPSGCSTDRPAKCS